MTYNAMNAIRFRIGAKLEAAKLSMSIARAKGKDHQVQEREHAVNAYQQAIDIVNEEIENLIAIGQIRREDVTAKVEGVQL